MCKETTFHREETRYKKDHGHNKILKKYITGSALLWYKKGKVVTQMENVEWKCFLTPINLFLKMC